MTKLTKEMQEAMYDPDIKAKAKEVLKYTIDKLLDPKKRTYADEMSEKIIRTPLNELKEWEDDFETEVYEQLTAKAKSRLNEAWNYDVMYDPKTFEERIKKVDDYRKRKATGHLSVGEILTAKMLKQKKQMEKMYGKKTYDPKKSAGSGIPKAWFSAMVSGIKRKSDVRNPYQIVKNIWKRLPVHTQTNIKRRAAAGEHFKYNLPLPEDLPTRGTGTLRIVKPFKLAEAQVNLTAKDMAAVKKSGIFRPMKRADGSICQVARCKGQHPVNIFVDQV